MAGSERDTGTLSRAADYDAVIVGASLAGCSTAIALGRAGARVALVEKRPDPKAFKRICGHFIQASAVPTIERLDLLAPIVAAGGLCTRFRIWTRWGWIAAPPDRAAQGVNLRRQLLDPLVREAAAAAPGVDLILDREVVRLSWDEELARGVVVRERSGREGTLRGRLVVGADGRQSSVAEYAGIPTKTLPHRRFVYAAYFERALPEWAPDTALWMLDPQCAAAFPTDDGLVAYAVVLTKDRLQKFKRDPVGGLVSFVGDLPDAPPIRAGRQVGSILGKLDMTNRARVPVGPGLALVGDAALAADPLFGVGCGWAFQSGAWLADSVAPALQGAEPLEKGLARYRRRHGRRLRGHAFFINDYSTGRPFSPAERMAFSAAARDPGLASMFDAYGTRQIGPARMLAKAIPRSLAVNARHAVLGRKSG